MKRFLPALALVCLPLAAEAQQTITFDGLPDGASVATLNLVYPGFSFGFNGIVRSGALFGDGMDAFPLFLASANPFTVVNVDLASATGAGNQLIVRGYTLDYIHAIDAAAAVVSIDGFFAHLRDAPVIGFLPTTLLSTVSADAGVFSTLPLGWQGLGAIVFTSTGGHIPGTPELVGGYLVDNISVTTTPEPASIVLLATGLLGVAIVRRRRAV